MKIFSLGVIVANVITPIVVVDAFSSASGLINQRAQARTRTQTQTRQPSQQPSSLLPPLAYLMGEGDDVDSFNDDSKKTTTTTTPPSTGTIIPTSTRTGTGINLNNYVDEKMIEDLQNQHLQMMQMQQQQQPQHQTSYSVTIPLVNYAPSSSTSPFTVTAIPSSMTMMSTITAATNNVNMSGIYDKLHDDLTYINIQLLRSKLSFLHRLLPKNKKQIDRFVNFLIQFIL